MTWSPFFTLVTPGPTSTTMPAPSWPRTAGNSPSGSAPESVNSSVWQMPVALISTSTSPAFGPSSSTSAITSGLAFSKATAARVFMAVSSLVVVIGVRSRRTHRRAWRSQWNLAAVADVHEHDVPVTVTASCELPLTCSNGGQQVGGQYPLGPLQSDATFLFEKKPLRSVEKQS